MRTYKSSVRRRWAPVILLSAMAFSTGLFGQSNHLNPDPRLYQALPKDYVDQLASQPRLLAYYNFFLDHAWFISEPKGKPVQGTDIFTVKVKNENPAEEVKYFKEDVIHFNAEAFNPLLYDFEIKSDAYTHYLMGNTGKVLVFLPHKEFTRKYNEFLKTLALDPASK